LLLWFAISISKEPWNPPPLFLERSSHFIYDCEKNLNNSTVHYVAISA
jgi:hypothetical protein